MAAGSLVASGIGIILMITVAYVLIGGTLSTAELVSVAQTDLALQQEMRMRTQIGIEGCRVEELTGTVILEVKNTGSEMIGDFGHMDIFLTNGTEIVHYPHGSGWNDETIVISPDTIHPGMLDPDEVMTITITYSGSKPTWIKIATGNGVYASTYI
jgi:archaeal flagellar protein FlaF